MTQNAWSDAGYRIITPNNRPVSVELHDTELESALEMLAEVENSNIAFQRDVNGKIRSLSVSGVPAKQVFDILLRLHGLYAEEVGNVIIVYPIEQYIRDAKARKALEDL